MREMNESRRIEAALRDADEWGRRGLQAIPAHIAVSPATIKVRARVNLGESAPGLG